MLIVFKCVNLLINNMIHTSDILLQFIQEALDADELRLQQFNTKFNLKDSQGLDNQSTSIGLSSVVQKPHLPRYVSWRSYLKYQSMEWS